MKCLNPVDFATVILLSMFVGWLLYPVTIWIREWFKYLWNHW